MAQLPTFLDLIKTESFDLALTEKGMSDAEKAKRDAIVDAMAADKNQLRRLMADHGEQWKAAAAGIATQQVISQREPVEDEAPEPEEDLEEDMSDGWKPTPKEIQGFLKARNAETRSVLDGIGFNDAHNLQAFGITKAAYSKIAMKAADRFGGTFWKSELKSPAHVAALFEGYDPDEDGTFDPDMMKRMDSMFKPGTAPKHLPNSVRCDCGNTFTPHYGEYHRCPDCLSQQHTDAEAATGVQEAELTTGQTAKRNTILNTMKPKATQYKQKYGVEGDNMMRADATRKAVSPNPVGPTAPAGPLSATDMIEAMFREEDTDWHLDPHKFDKAIPGETYHDPRSGQQRLGTFDGRLKSGDAAGSIHNYDSKIWKQGRPLKESPRAPFMPLKGHPYHLKSDAVLTYIIRDAGAAAVNMHGMGNAQAENKYLDQVNDASTILYYRRNGGSQVGATADNAHLA